MRSPRGLVESMRSPWERVGDCKIQLFPLNVSIILATGKINDVYYIIFCPITFIEPLLKTHQCFRVSHMGTLKVLNYVGSVNKLMRPPVDQECTPRNKK